MPRRVDKATEAKMYWTIVREARAERHAGRPFLSVYQNALEEVAAIQQYSDWPLLRHRISSDMARVERNYGLTVLGTAAAR